MQTIRVHTTQNVYIHYPLASVGDRILAHIIDTLVLVLYATAVIALLIKLELEIWWVWSVAGLPFLFYSLLFEIFMNGQSPGKFLMKIKVIRLDGTPPTVGDYILRWLFRAIDFRLFSPAVALIVITSGGKGQRLGDIAAGTSVIKLAEQKEITSHDLFVIAETDYLPVFSQVTNLTSRDIELIQQALEVNRSTGNNKPVVLLTEKLKSVLDIQSDLPPVKFLYTIVKDYNHLTSQHSG
jgi:uncharacterized RDD family membrane protein YckC